MAICKTMNFKLHTNLLHIQGVAHHFPTSRVLAFKASLDYNVNNDLTFLFEYNLHGCRILVEGNGNPNCV